MDRLTNELDRLREEDPNVAHVLDVYSEIERVYRDTLEAMGVTRKHAPEVMNSAEVTLSFYPTTSSSGEQRGLIRPVSKRKKKRKSARNRTESKIIQARQLMDFSKLDQIPATYQELSNYFEKLGKAKPFDLRKETFLRIENVTGTPLICYVTKTHNLPQGIPAYIDDSDITGFGDLIQSVQGEAVDIFIVSNGGSAEAAERLVRLLRERFETVRFIVPANAYSAATLICFSGNEIIMDSLGTLGPIDPQINGVPARAILRAFETVEKRLKEEGPRALTAYMPLISKYELHNLEICKSAQNLSEELARNWLSTYMSKCDVDDPLVNTIVDFFLNYDEHKSHGRSIDRAKASEVGLKVTNLEEIAGLADLVRSLYNQYELWFDKTSFYKLFENAKGINWGRQAQAVTVQLPQLVPPSMPQPTPQPGPPKRSG